jgi:hypothetical protein
MGIFDSKNFNTEVFGKYVETVPKVKQNALLNAGVINVRNDLKGLFDEQTGGNFATVPMTGLLGGTALNYDGATNVSSLGGLDTYAQSMIVVGRMASWTEKDFSTDITRKDFMEDIGKQVAGYWDDVDETTLLAILEGIFKCTDDSFNTKHTLDITSESGTSAYVGATTINSACQKAAGANKKIFTVAIMHSEVATNLENLNLLEYLKYTDANGVQRDLALATVNGKVVLIDDDVPTEAVAASGSGDSAVPAYTAYTTYVLGQGAFDFVDVGAKVPNEVYRDPHTNGGTEELITRQRKVFAPKGFSFVQPSTPVTSPTDAQLKTGARWAVVKSANNVFYNSKAIPFARIISKG